MSSSQLGNIETAVASDSQIPKLQMGVRDVPVSTKPKTPIRLSQGIKPASFLNKPNLKSPGSTLKSSLLSKSGSANKRI